MQFANKQNCYNIFKNNKQKKANAKIKKQK